MRAAKLWRSLGVVFAVAAALVSYKLLFKHMTGSSGSAWFEAGCTAEIGAVAGDCAAVLASPHSYWPAKKPDEPPGRPHVPVAFLGLLYFSAAAVWLIGVGRPSPSRRWVHFIPLFAVLCGLTISVRYTYLMYAALDAWCHWCLLTHVLNLLIGGCVLLMWPRAGKAVPVGPAAPPQAAVPMRPPHPSMKRVFGTVAVIAIVVYGHYGKSGLLAARRTNANLQQCLAAVGRIQADTAKLIRNWQLADELTITVRADDSVRTDVQTDQQTFDVVVFSDFQCPQCKRFADLLEERIRPLFAGRLRVFFKHYPLDTTCNPQASRTVHTGACVTARLAEAVRQQAGNSAFWKAHDLLFSRQADGAPHEPKLITEFARELALDASQLQAVSTSVEVASRIAEDAALAKTLGVRGTPAIFAQGRRVDPLAVLHLDFWDGLAELFWKQLDLPRPPASRLAAPAHADTGRNE